MGQSAPLEPAAPSGYVEDGAFDNEEVYRAWASDYYSPLTQRLYDRSVHRMLQQLAPPPGGMVLDAGCGTGVHSVRAARAGFRVQGVDVSRVALSIALQNAREEGVAERIRYSRADLTRLPFADASFDAVFSWGVVVHIPDVDLAVRELVRVLKPGSRIALQVTNHRAIDNVVEGAVRKVLGRNVGRSRSEYGVGWWCQMFGGLMWNWQMNIGATIRCLDRNNCRLVHRGAVEYTEWQRHMPALPRKLTLRWNDLYNRLRLPAAIASTNLLVFEKSR
ncbi:class I SAM-dependent methyltransferase [Humisphaera borealis]|uniref:Class I SAM-dependent methyltransferase n=1 Tax=Humisphaera borealis TaxID=2807512 RepID=A0A7M2WXP4_9BACT|nr:class I SAM-dependent methyltransferase [Humisphaera borealis]QOV90246.1 class I SAM-dependent methyltransferase [Humisphaera borealis]